MVQNATVQQATGSSLDSKGLANRLVLTLLTAALAFGLGCKKDEPESSAPEPEKVSAAKTDDKTADKKERATLESALTKDDEKDTPDRKLVKGKTADKAAAKPGAKTADKKNDEKADEKGKAGKFAPPARKPGVVKPSALQKDTAALDDEDGEDESDPRALAAARRADRGARTVPPARKAAVRPARVPPAAGADDAADDGLEDDDLPMRGPRGARARRGARRDRGAIPPSRRDVGADAADDDQLDTPAARRAARRAARDRMRDRRNNLPGRTGPDTAEPVRTAGLPTRVRPNAELLLRKTDLTEILEYTKTVDVHQLSGIEPGEEYDGIYWGSPNGSNYIAGLQVWRPRSPIEAQRRYSRMTSSYPNAEENTAITNKTFLAHWNDFIYLVFFDTNKQTVVSLTCERTVCNTPQKLVLLASRVKERL